MSCTKELKYGSPVNPVRTQAARMCQTGPCRKNVTEAGENFSCCCAETYRATISKTCIAKQIAIDSRVTWANNFIKLI
ncbi:MAG: hypothetical protein VX374_18695, partial [Pseudomonadota bacterium]|nr:hypothetical protein [Pseudomonadota bacterium]